MNIDFFLLDECTLGGDGGKSGRAAPEEAVYKPPESPADLNNVRVKTRSAQEEKH